MGEGHRPLRASLSRRRRCRIRCCSTATRISRDYGGLDDLPTSFFVDRKGVVVAAQVGLTSESDIESKIEKALGE